MQQKGVFMTISSSLNAGVAGLFTNATRLAAIADNISNSSTYGYKRVEADFHSLVVGGQNRRRVQRWGRAGDHAAPDRPAGQHRHRHDERLGFRGARPRPPASGRRLPVRNPATKGDVQRDDADHHRQLQDR